MRCLILTGWVCLWVLGFSEMREKLHAVISLFDVMMMSPKLKRRVVFIKQTAAASRLDRQVTFDIQDIMSAYISECTHSVTC